MGSSPRAAAFLAVLVAVVSVPGLTAQCGSNWVPGHALGVTTAAGIGGSVMAVAAWDPDGPGPAAERLVVGGAFVQIADRLCANVASFDPASSTWDDLGGGANGTVEAIAVLPTGDLVIAGQFTNAGGVPADHIARWDGSQWNAMGGANAAVHALTVLANGDLVAGGGFTSIDGVAATLVARWDGVAWAPLPGLPTNTTGVLALGQAANGDLVAGGLFTDFIKRWNGATWSAIGGNINGTVFSVLPMPNGDVVVAGSFSNVGGVTSRGVARWSGTQWNAMPGLDGSALALLREPNGDILVGGSFTYAGSAYSPRAARWDGQNWQSLGGFYGNDVRALTHFAADVIAGGNFHGVYLIGVNSALGLATWSGTTWAPTCPAFNGQLQSLRVLRSGDVIAAGGFTTSPAGPVPALARFRDGRWGTLPTPGLVGTASGPLIELANGDLVAVIYSPASYTVQRFDGQSWTSLGSLGSSWITAIVELTNGDLVAAFGQFLSRFDGTTWTTTSAPGTPTALAALPNGAVAVFGQLGNIGFAAKWNGTAFTPLASPASGTASAALQLPNGDWIVGGRDLAVTGGTTCVARWDGVEWSALGGPVGGALGDVQALALLPTGGLVATGSFQFAGAALVNNAARWDGEQWSALGFGLSGTPVRALAVLPDGSIAAGGYFQRAGAQLSPYFAHYVAGCPATATPVATACVGPAGPLALVADALPWVGSTFRATATGFAAGALGVALLGLQNPAQPLGQYFPTALPNCDLLAGPDAILLTVPAAGAASFAFAIPNDPVFAALPLQHQFLQLALSAQGAIVSASSSNGLALVLGIL